MIDLDELINRLAREDHGYLRSLYHGDRPVALFGQVDRLFHLGLVCKVWADDHSAETKTKLTQQGKIVARRLYRK
jgi:hypothetical protein